MTRKGKTKTEKELNKRHDYYKKLKRIVQDISLPEGDLDAGYAALDVLIGQLEGSLQIVKRSTGYFDIAAEDDSLRSVTCIDLPGGVADESNVLSNIISKVRPGLILEPHPTMGTGYYRLKNCGALTGNRKWNRILLKENDSNFQSPTDWRDKKQTNSWN